MALRLWGSRALSLCRFTNDTGVLLAFARLYGRFANTLRAFRRMFRPLGLWGCRLWGGSAALSGPLPLKPSGPLGLRLWDGIGTGIRAAAAGSDWGGGRALHCQRRSLRRALAPCHAAPAGARFTSTMQQGTRVTHRHMQQAHATRHNAHASTRRPLKRNALGLTWNVVILTWFMAHARSHVRGVALFFSMQQICPAERSLIPQPLGQMASP